MAAYKIGAVARQTGLSRRMLRHYDAIGLLKPARRTRSGHRLYADEHVAQLRKILSLRRLGFALHEIQAILSGNAEVLPGQLKPMSTS